MTVIFRCGCVGVLKESQTGGERPVCPTHRAPVQRVSQVRPPVFVGHVSGPHAITKALDPASPVLTETPLILKPPREDAPHGE